MFGSYVSSRASVLDGYFPIFEKMINSGAGLRSIKKNLISKGYKGSESSIKNVHCKEAKTRK